MTGGEPVFLTETLKSNAFRRSRVRETRKRIPLGLKYFIMHLARLRLQYAYESTNACECSWH